MSPGERSKGKTRVWVKGHGDQPHLIDSVPHSFCTGSLLEPRCSLTLMLIESDASEDKRQHVNNKNQRDKKNVALHFCCKWPWAREGQGSKFQPRLENRHLAGWRREEGGEIPTARLSGNHVQVLFHHSPSPPEPLPCTPLLQPAQETVFTLCQFQKSGSTFSLRWHLLFLLL